MTLSRPRTTGRVLRGSALGLGLLVTGGITAPAAFAAVDPSTTPTEVPVEGAETPTALESAPDEAPALARPLAGNFGTGKFFEIQTAPQNSYPGDLDLSGATFTATPVPAAAAPPSPVLDLAGDSGAYTCTTDQTGACTFSTDAPGEIPGDTPPWATWSQPDAGTQIPAGTYRLTQTSTSPGLAANTGSATFTICSPTADEVSAAWDHLYYSSADCPQQVLTGSVEVDSLFRTSLVTTVLDEETEEPISGMGYTLTAPDYPHRTYGLPSFPFPFIPRIEVLGGVTDNLVGDETDPVEFGEQISGTDGSLTFGGRGSWFLPGAGYTLTPTDTVPEGYPAPPAYAFAVSTTATQSAQRTPVSLVRLLGTGLAAGNSPDAPGDGGVAPGAPAPAVATTTAAGAAGSAGSGTATATGTTSTAAALATTGSPVMSMALLGGGLVALGGGALLTGATLRRRARRSA